MATRKIQPKLRRAMSRAKDRTSQMFAVLIQLIDDRGATLAKVGSMRGVTLISATGSVVTATASVEGIERLHAADWVTFIEGDGP